MQYSMLTTILKGVFAAIGGGAYGALIQWVMDGVSTGNWAMSADAQSIAITLIVAAASAIHASSKNWWKNYAVPKINKAGKF